MTTTASAAGKFEVRFYHLVFGTELGRVKGHFGPVNTCAFSPDGRGFASGAEDGYVGGCFETYYTVAFSLTPLAIVFVLPFVCTPATFDCTTLMQSTLPLATTWRWATRSSRHSLMPTQRTWTTQAARQQRLPQQGLELEPGRVLVPVQVLAQQGRRRKSCFNFYLKWVARLSFLTNAYYDDEEGLFAFHQRLAPLLLVICPASCSRGAIGPNSPA